MGGRAAVRVLVPRTAAGEIVLIISVSLLLRVTTFGLSELSWDESAFALVGREILHGHWPFTTVFDHKPIGLYLHFAAAFALFGDNPTATRILGWIVVTATAIAIRAILAGPVALARPWPLLVSCALLFALLGYGGQAVLSEHFVNLYSVLAALFLLRRRHGAALLAGVCAGIAINTNYLALPVLAGLLAGYLAAPPISAETVRERLGSIALLALGCIAATLVLLAPILLFSKLGDYFGPQVAFLLGYADNSGPGHRLMLFVTAVQLLIPLVTVALAALCLKPEAGQHGRQLWPFGGMLLGSTAATLVSGYVYAHYVLLMLPPLWLCVAVILRRATDRPQRVLLGAALAGTSLMIAFMPSALWAAGMGVEDLLAKRRGDLAFDLPRQLARIAAPHIPPGGTIYAACAQPVIYQLVHVEPPTRYAFYPDMFAPRYASSLRVDPKAELQAIFSRRPSVVILGDVDECWSVPQAETWHMVDDALRQHGYRLFARHEDFSFFEPPGSDQSGF